MTSISISICASRIHRGLASSYWKRSFADAKVPLNLFGKPVGVAAGQGSLKDKKSAASEEPEVDELGHFVKNPFPEKTFVREAKSRNEVKLRNIRALGGRNSVYKHKPSRHPGLGSNRPILLHRQDVMKLHEQKAEELGLPWRIVAAPVLHRYPTIMPDSPPWMDEFDAMIEEEDNRSRQWFIDQVKGTELDIIPHEHPTYEEIINSLPFKPAPRVTEADLNNDRRSLDRRLPKSVYLVVKRNRSDHSWQFPQGKVMDEESLRFASQRIMERTVGKKAETYFIGNRPCGYYAYAYPPELQKQRGQYGAKVFFLRTQLISGALKIDTKFYKDYAWITRDEVHEYFDTETADYLKEMLLD